MDAYYDTYTSPEPDNEFMRDISVKDLIPIFRELLSPSGSEPKMRVTWPLFLPACKCRSGARVARYLVALRTLTN